MTLDQKIQIWNAIGTWFAGIATFLAVLVSLYLARKAERLNLKVSAGIRLIFEGDGSPAEENVGITVTNLGDRPVIINSIGWKIGKGKEARYCIQPVTGKYTHQYPKQLAHGEQCTFLVSFKITPDWKLDFANGFVKDLSNKNLKSLRAQVHTSIGQTIEVMPDSSLLEKLRETSNSN